MPGGDRCSSDSGRRLTSRNAATVRYLGIEVDDALTIGEQIDV
jgi:hypothetical protein